MRTLLVKIASPIVVIVGLVLCAEAVHGCTCAPASLSGSYEAATKVFAGYATVVRLGERSTKGWRKKTRQVTVVEFHVEKWWKGGISEKVIVETGMGDHDCGSDFRVGRRYIIFAQIVGDGWLVTGICSGNRYYDARDREVAELDQLADPRNQSK